MRLVHLLDETGNDILGGPLSTVIGWFNKKDRIEDRGRLYVSRDSDVQQTNNGFELPEDTLTMAMKTHPVLVRRTLHCDSFLTALAKIGGLMAILKISIFLLHYHTNSFEKKLSGSSSH